MESEIICRIPSDWARDFSQCLYDWQTLISGLLALIAAALTVILIQRQIQQSERHKRDEINREHNAAKVVLPFALAAIDEYCREASRHIADTIDEIDAGNWRANLADATGDPITLPHVDFPSSGLEAISRFVATLDDDISVKHMNELTGRLQILNSRYISFDKNRPNAKSWTYDILIDCGIVGYLINSLYDYARSSHSGGFAVVGEKANAESWDGVQKATTGFLFKRKFLDVYVQETWKKISEYIENDTFPWMTKFET